MKSFLLKLLFFLFLFAVLGLFREHIFLNLNNIIYYKYYKSTSVPIPFGFGWLTRFSFTTLYYLKYPLTLVFVLLFYYLNFLFLKKFNVYPFYIKLLSWSYIVLFLISVSAMLYAYYFQQKLDDDEYLLSRGLMGTAQSPLIAFVLFALYLWDKNKLHYHEKRNSGL